MQDRLGEYWINSMPWTVSESAGHYTVTVYFVRPYSKECVVHRVYMVPKNAEPDFATATHLIDLFPWHPLGYHPHTGVFMWNGRPVLSTAGQEPPTFVFPGKRVPDSGQVEMPDRPMPSAAAMSLLTPS